MSSGYHGAGPAFPTRASALVTLPLQGYQRLLVITGTRWGRPDVWDTLDLYVSLWGMPFLILGGDLDRGVYSQRGVDLQARQWAAARGCHGVVEYAFWDKGTREGPRRNERMVARAAPGQHLLAFPHHRRSRGTWGCFELGRDAGLHAVAVKNGWPNELRALEMAA